MFTLLGAGVKERHLLRLYIINKDYRTEAVGTVGHHRKKTAEVGGAERHSSVPSVSATQT